MKFIGLIAGAASVSAAVTPQKVDLTPFNQNAFPLLSPQQAASNLAAAKPSESAQIAAAPSAAAAGGPVTHLTAATCATPKIRYEWRGLTDAHKAQYVAATVCLMRAAPRNGIRGARTRYEELVSVHQQMNPTIHNVGQFLPWHRYMMHVYEDMLRTECGYTGPMTWWDETRDAGNFHNAPMFTASYFGSAPVKTSSGQGTCVSNGAFANIALHIGPGSSDTTHCLSRAVDEGLSRQINSNFVNTCNSHTTFNDMQSCSFFGPHAYGHNAVGAVMSDVMASPSDPIFFLHHGFIDHNWRIWQNANPARLGSGPQGIGGYTTQGGRTPTTLSYSLSSMGLRPAVPISSVMNTLGTYLCYKYDY